MRTKKGSEICRMFDCKYKIYFDNVRFDSLYGTDYYNDKPNFFAHGAKQFFTIYQILRSGDFYLTIVEENSGARFEFDNTSDFRIWVEQNYYPFKDYLDKIYWDKHPGSKPE